MALSNLVVTDFTAPEFVKNGQTISLAWTVENQGSEATTSELNYWYDRIVYSIDDIFGNEDDVYLTDFYIPEYASLPLDVNSNYTIDLNITVPNDLTGLRYLLVKTDFYNNQIETDETDNVRSVAINVTAPQVNLVVTDFTAPESAKNGETISLSWKVENQGSEATTSSYWYDSIFYSTDDVFGNEDDFYITDVYTPYYASLPLDANGNYTITSNITIPSYLTGQGYLFVKTDISNNQIETDETDNLNSVTINIIPPQDNLVVTNFTAPADAVAGQTISLSWTVENQGSEATTSSYWYDSIFYSTDDVFGNEDDVYLTQVYTPNYASLPLDVNGNYTINANITVPNYLTGQGYLLVQTDVYNYQAETDETDNVSSVAFSIIPPDINLVVTDIVAPSSAINGQNISLSWTVENQGTTATTSYSWYDRIFYSTDDVFGNSDDIYLTQLYTPYYASLPLEANETYTLTTNVYLPSNLAGSGYLFVKTDWYNEQIETDETDNVYSVPITFSGPNLVVTNATAPTAVNTGQTVSLSWTVQNQGDAATTASSWYDRVVFSKDTIFGNSDDIYITEPGIYSYANLPLDPNETYTVTQNFTLPNNIGGSGYLLFKTDNYNYQLEANEQDNVYSLPIDVTAPNLVISNPTPPPTSAILGETIAVSWLVTNTGTVSANADWYDAVYVSNDDKFDNSDVYVTDIWTGSNTPLAPNASYTINRNITLPASAGVGNRYLLFVADYYNNYQGETSETDNVVATPITLSAPDVVVTAATAPETGGSRGTVNVSWTVKNEGTVQAPTDWYDYVYLSTDDIFGNFNDSYVYQEYISTQTPLAANGSYTINRSITLPNVTAGNYYLLFKADGSNNQGETNENNNVRAVPITVNVPDLVVSAATAPTNGIANGSIAVAYTVKNEGTVGSQTNWYDYVYLSTDATYSNSDTYITGQYISTPSSLAAGESYTKNFNLTLPNSPAGDYYLLFMADRFDYQRETNENNNLRAVPITIGVPDLIVTEATAPTSGVLGETINVAWTVTNSGTVTAPADWTDRVYFSVDNIWDNADTLVTSESITSQTPLTAGSSYTINRSFTLPNQVSAIGSGYLLFVADGSASQTESSETNNVKAVAFTLNAPNLVVTSATAPNSVAIGDSLALSWTVANQGSVAANADWYDSVYISNDATFDSGDQYLTSRWAGADTPIAAGGTYTGSLNVTLPSTTTGDRYLLFVADNYYYSSNYQGETNESDNVYAVPINISAADLTIDAVTAPSQAIASQTVTLSWTVKNQGTGQASQDWYDYVYLSTNNTLDGSDTLLSSELIAAQTPLAAGDSYTISKNVTLSSNIIGQRYLIFAADGSGNQGETNENNNTKVVAINFTAPDLIVSTATAPTSANLGDSVAVSWTVTNQSTTDAPADWSDYVYVSNDNVLDAADTLIATESISSQTPLVAGNSYTINRNINLTSNTATGNRYLLFVADGSQNQGETDNTNNVRAVPITLNAPDLVVSNITAPVEVISGQPLEIAWTDKNQGNTAATGTWYDYVYLQNQNSGQNYYIGTFEFTGTLAAGASIDRTQTINIPIQLQGNYRVVVTTDYSGNIPEGTQNESNNTTVDDRSIQVKLAPIPNLQVSSVTAPPTAFSSQGTVVQWTVTNAGNGATSSAYWNDVVYLSLDNTYDDTDVYLGQASNPSYLNAGDSYTNSLNVTLPRGISGNYYFLVKTDVNNNVFENDLEGDNFGFGGPTNVSLTPPPDFQVTNVTTPSQGFSGQPLNISWTVANKGQGKNLETNWYDQVFMSADDVLDGSDRNLGTFYRSGTLNSNSSYTTSQTVNLPIGVSGDYFFFVRTDAGNQVYENVFESNNTGYKTPATRINLTPPPDLEIDSINAPSQATASRTLTFTYQVTNYGATTTPNTSWTDTFYLSGDNQLDVNADLRLGSQIRYGSLAPDGSYSNTVSFTLPNTITGNYYLFAVTDSSNEVFELDNNNNTAFASTPITITSKPADLVISAATAPTTAEAGKAIRVEWTVPNQGTGDTVVNSWTDNVILSADTQVGNGDDITLGSFSRNGLLNPNGSYTRSELVTLPIETVGQYRVFVVTDAGNGVYEASNENNNTSTGQPLTVTRQTPDLQVTQVSSPTSGQSGQALTVNWTVQNFGTNRTNSNYWYDGVYLSTDNQISGDDIFLGNVYHSGALDAAEQYSVSRSFNLPANLQGNYYTIVKTDVNNNVFEASLENNNDKASEGITEGNGTTGGTTIGLTPTPDLVIDTVDAPATGISGQNLSINWTVRNTGSVETGQRSWYEAFYLSRDQVFDRNTDTYLGYSFYNGNLGSGATYSKTESFRIPQGISGPLYVFAVTDAGNSVYERDGENNNVAYDGNSVAVTLSQPADLVVGTITIPANGVPGQNATISYTVNNQGQNPALGSWFDSIYISADNQWDVNDALFGRVQHFGDVASGGSYSQTLTAALPGLLPGNYYAIVRSDIRNQIPESNESNNITASLNQFAADAERLELGTADTGSLGQGQAAYYRVDVAAGETLRVKFDSASTTAANELYIRYGDVPSRSQFDFGFSDVLAADQDILVPTTRSGTYYILAYGASVGGTPANYSIEADVLGFEILDIGTKRGSNLGQTTITISGSKFSTNDVVSLVAADGNGRTASRVWWKNSTELWATFDLQGLTTGLYDVKVENGAQTATLDDAFTVSNGRIGNLTVNVDAPSALRPGQPGIVTVNYANTGETDIVAPLLTLVAENANLRLPEQTESVGSSLQFLGINSQGPAGIIAPGASGSFSLLFNPTVNDGSVTFSVSQAANDQTIDWDSLKNQARPNNISNEAWDAIWQNFITSVGNQAGTYREILADNANHLSLLGEYTNDAIRLLGFELLQVSNSLVGSNQGDSIDERFSTGTFGRGGVNDWDIKVTPDSNGDVTLFFGTAPRLFTKQSDGSYKGVTGDNATLTLEGGIYRLREDDGTLIAFRLDGKFDYIEDTNQNRITANYTDGKLTRLVHSDGNYLEFSYNAQGLISQTTDQDNWKTTYEYDTTGQYLLSITTPDGTTSYTYETNSTSVSQHAIKSVRFSDNTGLFYEYDNQGRLIKQSLDGNSEPITYSYDSSGGVTITDASGAVSKLLYNDRGTLGRIEDPLKRITQYQYDSNGNLTKLTAADNTVSTFTYDNQGNLISSVNALGQQIKYTYETNFNQLASVRDQRGNPLNYSYDSQGNLQQITYADGSKETFSYDATGNVTVAVNRRHQNISYTYNSEGLLTRKDFADGTSATYTYDSRGNLLSATDSDSSVTYTYDSLDRVTKVSYGADRFLEFTYDSAGRRSRMVDQDGFTTNYSYDTLGRLKSLTDATGANIISYTYDNVGRLSREDNGNGTYTTYSYDLAGQLLSLVNYESNGSVNSRFDYTYDNAGRRTSMTTLEGTTTYGYDSIGQLTLVNLPNGRIIEYQYDAAGNRIKVKDSGVETAYSTNNLNQYTSVGAATYSYDTDGNLISKTQGGNTWTYSYDSENRLIGAVTPEGTWSYEYDALGNRIASILNGQRTEYLLDPTGLGDVVGEYGGNGNIIARYTHGLGLVSRVDGTNAASYYDADAIGSIVGLTGADGDYLNQYGYLPFGESLSTVEAVSNPFEYVGQWGVMREGNSLDFMRARFYDPFTGKFTSPDPFGIGGGDTNFYRYSINNPNTYIDPSGNFFFVPFLIAAAIGAGTGAVSGAVTDAAIQGVKIAAGVQDKFDWGSVGESAAWGAVTGAVTGGIAGGLGRGLVKEAGQEWSHAIARKYGAELSRSGKTINDQKKWFIPEALVDEKNSRLGKVMGNFRSPERHALNDPDRHRFFPKPWKDNNPLNNKWKRFIDRVPDWMKDGFAAGGFGGILGSAFSRIIRPSDPNDILGPAGFGEEKWITASSTLPYTIRFENQASATAPAQQVVITQKLDPDLDFRTYRVGDFGWGDLFFDVPDNRAFYNERLDLTATKGFYVDVSAGIDVTTGEAFWTITTIDPNTGEIPENALTGFLPPNNEDGVGDGFVNYSIRPKRNVQTGAVIDAEARIVFDTEEPIDTPPIFNTIDAGTPSSTVNVLPATSQPGEFLVTWSGSDDSNGSALANYTIYVSDNGADFTPWLENTTLTEANYIGQAGHTYAFYSVARDNAGNIEAAPSTADAETTIPGSTILSFSSATYSINEDGTPVTAVTINRDGSIGTLTATLTLANGTATAPADYDNTPISVNFANGETSKTVTIPIVNDAIAEGNETFTLSLGSSSNYQLGNISTATVTIIDNDTAGVTITQSGGSTNVTEGGATDTYTVVLTSQPTADVSITLGNTQTTTNVNTLTFTAANWNIAQTVTVTAIDDAVIEGNHTGVITHTASSSDTNYNGINIGAVNVNIADNDFNVITSSGRDPLTGTAANDRIVGGAGAKTITGGAGRDEFVYTNLRDVGHRITDFTVGEDKIVLTQLLSSIGYQGTNPINDGYVRLIQGSTANSTVLQIDRDGAIGSAIFRNFLQLDNVTPSQMNSVDNFVF